MSYLSFELFFIFLPLSSISFWLIKRCINYNTAKAFLLSLSLVLIYLFDAKSCILLASVVITNYLFYKVSSQFPKYKKQVLITSVVSLISYIVFYKYYGLIVTEDAAYKFRNFLYASDYLIPLGISFYSFQLISFQVDHYKGKVSKISFLDFSLYICFFPQLISGPIVRISRFKSQLKNSKIKTKFLYAGITLITLGLAKKLIIADSIELLYKSKLSGFHADIFFPWDISVAMIFGMTSQIYLDFSAYSDIAIGIGYLFGFSLPVNFRSPARAPSLAEGWRRWNITLTKFIHRYVYKNLLFLPRPLLIYLTLLIFGLWHGPFLGFVIFSLAHGSILVLIYVLRAKVFKVRTHSQTKPQIVFEKFTTVFAALALMPLLRVMDINYYIHILKSLIQPREFYFTHLSIAEFIFPIITFLGLLTLPNSIELMHGKNLNPIIKKSSPFLLAVLLFCSLFFLNRSQNFIYFFF